MWNDESSHAFLVYRNQQKRAKTRALFGARKASRASPLRPFFLEFMRRWLVDTPAPRPIARQEES